MKKCPNCGSLFDVADSSCAECSYEITKIDGFECFAPEYAYEGGGFKPHYFEQLYSLESSNFWFRIRNQLINWALEKYTGAFESFLEIGCGTGFVLSGVSRKYPQASYLGSEIFVDGLRFAAKRLPESQFIQIDARKIPFDNEFDVIGAFDVLEHIDEDELVVREVYSALRSGGTFVLSVPQHQWLWSATDDYACHVRRYDRRDLISKLENAGFLIQTSTSFVSLLVPFLMLSRVSQKKLDDTFDPLSEFRLPRMLNSLLYFIMKIELLLVKGGIRFPVGGSLLVVAKKPD